MAYTETKLYGGAITAKLPANFMDASTVRTIPDTQEVYLSKTSLASIVFDILERVEAPAYAVTAGGEEGDYEALRFHLYDVVSGAGARMEEGEEEKEEARVVRMDKVVAERLGPGVPAYSLLATIHPTVSTTHQLSHQQQQENGNDDEQQQPVPQFTAEILTLIRLEQKRTDILISVNVPHVQGEYDPVACGVDLGKGEQGLGSMVQEGREWMRVIVHSFGVEDWGLFDG